MLCSSSFGYGNSAFLTCSREAHYFTSNNYRIDVFLALLNGNRAVLLHTHLQVDPLEASRLVDVGPAADKKAEAAKFRQFWGDRAELRRFKVNLGGCAQRRRCTASFFLSWFPEMAGCAALCDRMDPSRKQLCGSVHHRSGTSSCIGL